MTVGRADVDGYVVLPAEGAGLLRRLEEGLTPGESTIAAMAAACGDRDVVTCADFDAELVRAATGTADRQSEIAIATDLPARPTRGSLTTLTCSHQN